MRIRHTTGYQLVSAQALTRLIRTQIGTLRLDPALPDHDLRMAFETCFHSPDPAIRATADWIARRIGRGLGLLLLVLRRGDARSRAERPEWNDSYWAHWATIRQVWLGGGLVSGELGARLPACALDVLTRAGITGMAIRVSPYAPVLPLVGAARHVPPGCQTALVFDFGSTWVKRAIGRCDASGALVALDLLPPRPAPPYDSDDPIWCAEQVRDGMLAIFADTWHEARAQGEKPCGALVASLSAYVRNGQPLAAQHGSYVHLMHLGDNAAALLSEQATDRLGIPAQVTLIHDGTAAAAAHAGSGAAAVITIGTALGIGFPPPVGDLRPLRL